MPWFFFHSCYVTFFIFVFFISNVWTKVFQSQLQEKWGHAFLNNILVFLLLIYVSFPYHLCLTLAEGLRKCNKIIWLGRTFIFFTAALLETLFLYCSLYECRKVSSTMGVLLLSLAGLQRGAIHSDSSMPGWKSAEEVSVFLLGNTERSFCGSRGRNWTQGFTVPHIMFFMKAALCFTDHAQFVFPLSPIHAYRLSKSQLCCWLFSPKANTVI